MKWGLGYVFGTRHWESLSSRMFVRIFTYVYILEGMGRKSDWAEGEVKVYYKSEKALANPRGTSGFCTTFQSAPSFGLSACAFMLT